MFHDSSLRKFIKLIAFHLHVYAIFINVFYILFARKTGQNKNKYVIGYLLWWVIELYDWTTSGNWPSYADTGTYKMSSGCRICTDKKELPEVNLYINVSWNIIEVQSWFLHYSCLVFRSAACCRRCVSILQRQRGCDNTEWQCKIPRMERIYTNCFPTTERQYDNSIFFISQALLFAVLTQTAKKCQW